MSTEVMVERTPFLIATEINSIKDQTRKMLLVNSIEIGRRLVEAKELVPHGEWGKWLEESVDYSKTTARNLIRIFEEYGADQFSLFGSEAKSQALGDLSYTQAVALLGVPTEEREDFIKENNIDSMSTRELQKAIKEKQVLEEKLKRELEAKAKLEEKHEKLESQRKKWSAEVNNLKTLLEAAESNGNDEEVQRLQEGLRNANNEAAEAQERIKTLEEQLKAKPVVEVVEKLPEKVEQELEDLRKKVANSGSTEAEVKFKYQFESLVSGFKDILVSLGNVEDPEKYKKAVKGLIDKMAERL